MSQPAHRLREPRHERDAPKLPHLVMPDAADLARWLTAAHDSPGRLWQTYDDPAFARLWYGARAAGEQLRAEALADLARRYPRSSGPHPDPRDPAPFELSAILAAAARLVGVRLWPVPINPPRDPKSRKRPVFVEPPNATDDHTPRHLAWLIVYPEGRVPDLALSPCRDRRLLHFDAACLLGLYTRMRDHLATPHAPLPPTLLLLPALSHSRARQPLPLQHPPHPLHPHHR